VHDFIITEKIATFARYVQPGRALTTAGMPKSKINPEEQAYGE
jgi:hypothetical protein